MTKKLSLPNNDANALMWRRNLTLTYFLFQSTFQECLVDARMLEHISKKEHQKYLKLVDGFHRFVLSVTSLIKVDYTCTTDRQID